MSEENVDLVRRWTDRLARGDLPLELSDPELQVDNIAGLSEGLLSGLLSPPPNPRAKARRAAHEFARPLIEG
jgi:hypothetical protein